MRGKTLFRLRPSEDSILFAEPIDIGTRVRDLLLDGDGRVILWTDQSEIVSLEAKTANAESSMFSAYCSGCHDIKDGTSHGIGPDLYEVHGATAARQTGFEYSPALADSRIRWNDDTLDAYLRNPQDVIPGTTMSFAGIDDTEIRATIIRYLKNAR
jgi:cytochrome c